MKKIILLIMVFCSFAPLFTGCEYHDINRRLFIVEMGIDSVKESKMIGVSFKATIPSGGTMGGGEKQQSYATYYVEVETLGEAMVKLKAQTSLEPDYGHLKVIIIGRRFAENHPIRQLIDYLIRRRDIQMIAFLLIGDPAAKEIVFSTAKDSNVPGSEIFMKFGQGTISPYAQQTSIYEIYRSIYTPGETPYCPIADTFNQKVVVDRVAVLDRDFKMKYALSPEETETFKILTNTSKSAYINMLASDNEPFGALLVNVFTKTSFKSDKDNNIICDVNIKGTAMLEDTPKSFQNIGELSDIFSNKLNQQASSLINKFQSLGLDPTLFIKKYWASNSSFEFTDNWPKEIFPNIKFNVSTKIKIQATGTLQ